jgi:protein involved in polysaccharide export with SLBB domain
VVLASGCRVLDEKTSSAVSTPGLAILAAFHPAGTDQGPPDLALIKAAPQPGDVGVGNVGAGDVVDCTVWDLYEPGEPHTFPLRVTPDRRLELPLAGPITLTAATPTEIERQIERAYRDAGVLQTPRVVVRPLEQTGLTVRVSGAVFAPGDARLARDQATVFAAIVQAGGLKPNAGRQIGLVRGNAAAPLVSPANAVSPTSAASAPLIRGQSEDAAPDATPEATPPAQSVEATASEEPLVPAVESPPKTAASTSTAPSTSPSPGRVEWYDLSVPAQVGTLRDLRLQQGDEVIVSTQVAPIRVLGSVGHPGPIPTHSDRPQSVDAVLSEAGGIRTGAWPVVVTLYRPPADGQRARQYSWTLTDADAPIDAREPIRPGDILHVAPTTGTRIKTAVGLFWKPASEP